MNPFIILLVGMGVVLLGLTCIIGIVKLMSFICAVFFEKRASRPSDEKPGLPMLEYDSSLNRVQQTGAHRPAVMSVEQRRQLTAVISAAIAAQSGIDAERIRICSIRRLGEGVPIVPIKDRREFIAAVSAAIAAQSNIAVDRMRICSIRRIDAGAPAYISNPGRGELVAAISSAIAEASGSDCAGLRLVSIRRI